MSLLTWGLVVVTVQLVGGYLTGKFIAVGMLERSRTDGRKKKPKGVTFVLGPACGRS